MYAGTTFRKNSGTIVGVHQKIDKAARYHLIKHDTKKIKFPSIKDILHFEGNNGPDGLKRKGSSEDEPWHFIDPDNLSDRQLIIMINDHIYNLSSALKKGDYIKSSFEAAWLAHAIVDGLTPAHHYPLGDKIEELWGKSHNNRNSVKNRIVVKGSSLKDTISKNWQYIGADGVLTAHLLFEAGIASAISTSKFRYCSPNKKDYQKIQQSNFEEVYYEALSKIHKMKMYEEFGRNGWTYKLANKTKKILIPEIIRTVSLAWSYAILLAQESNNES